MPSPAYLAHSSGIKLEAQPRVRSTLATARVSQPASDVTSFPTDRARLHRMAHCTGAVISMLASPDILLEGNGIPNMGRVSLPRWPRAAETKQASGEVAIQTFSFILLQTILHFFPLGRISSVFCGCFLSFFLLSAFDRSLFPSSLRYCNLDSILLGDLTSRHSDNFSEDRIVSCCRQSY
jgi:hypothetical protein